LLTITLSLITSAYCFAQTDYAVTAKGDTLRGDVKILPSDLADQVQVKINKKKKVYLCTELITVVQDGVLYKTVKFDNRFRYMTLLKNGFLSLYGFRMPQQTSYDGRYLQMRDGRGLEMPNLTFKRSLSKFLEDCPSVSERVKNGDLGRNDIDKIIDEYNTCLVFKSTKRNVDVPASSAILSNTQEVDNFIKKVEESPDFATKKDAIDLLRDLSGKIYRDEILPNYLVKELRANLKDQAAFAEELEKILAKAKMK
ncbi:MAG: hypothetical protein ACKOE6_14990, partial [Flammeovirgaceae bacterium]